MIFRTGNVVKTHNGSIEIVTKVTDDYTHTISFDYENSSSYHNNKTTTINETCWDCNGGVNLGCEICKGVGTYEKVIYGMEDAKIIGHTVKNYVIGKILKNFDF